MEHLKEHLPAAHRDETFKFLINYTMPLHLFKEPLSEIYIQNVLTYILTGENDDILATLQTLSDNNSLLKFMGTFGDYIDNPLPRYKYTTEKIQFTTGESRYARHLLSFDLFERMSNEQIIRYAKTMVAITGGYENPQFHDITPVWFSYLVSDAFVRFMGGFDKKRATESWSLTNVMALLQTDKSDEQTAVRQILGAFFERKMRKAKYDEHMLHICQIPDFKEFVIKYKDIFYDFIPTLSMRGQTVFISYLKRYTEQGDDVQTALAPLITALTIGGKKKMQELATPIFGGLSVDEQLTQLGRFLANGNSKERIQACECLVRLGSNALPVLQNALAQEKTKSIKTAIADALAELDTTAQVQDIATQIPPVVMPEIQMLPDSIAEILANNYDKELQWLQEMAIRHSLDNYYKDYVQSFLKNSKEIFVQQACDFLQGKTTIRPAYIKDVATFNNKLMLLPEFGAYHALLLNIRITLGDWGVDWEQLREHHTQIFKELELRQLILLIEKIALDKGLGGDSLKRSIAFFYLSGRKSILSDIITDDDKIYPFFAENLDFIKEALGLIPDKSDDSFRKFTFESGIWILKKFPSIPQELIAPLFDFAFGAKKWRLPAQEVLEKLPDIRERLLEKSNDKKQQIRTIAKEWLTELDRKPDDITKQLLPVVMPEIEVLPDSITDVFVSAYDKELQKRHDRIAENPLDTGKQAGLQYFLEKTKGKEIFVQESCDYLQGKSHIKPDYLEQLVNSNKEFHQNLMSFSKFGAYHALLLCVEGEPQNWKISWWKVREYYAKCFWHLELRQILLLIEKIALEQGLVIESLEREIANHFLIEPDKPLAKIVTDDDKIYPFFAENLDFIQEALGFLPSKYPFYPPYRFTFEMGVEVLRTFPSIPPELIAPLFEVAFGRKPALRLPAQQALDKLPDIHERLFELLNDKKPHIRIMAIQWLARRNDKSAITPLNERLQKEKEQKVVDEIVAALASLGES